VTQGSTGTPEAAETGAAGRHGHAPTRTGRKEEAPTSRGHDGGHGGPDRADRGRRRGGGEGAPQGGVGF
jgi:hypothetical protein